MASISCVLQDNDGNDLYPYTFDQEVLDANNVPISQRLGSASEASAVSGSSAFAKINTLNSDLTNIDTDTTSVTGVTFQRNGHLVNMSSYGGTKANLHGAYVPVKYRPNQEFNAAIYLRDGTNAYMGILSINSSGMIRTTYIATYPADNSYPPNNATCYFNVTYFAD